MSKFQDKNGQEWILDLNVGMIEDIKDQTGVDFDLVFQKPEEIATLLFSEPKKLVGVLWIICEEQAKERLIDPKKFGYGFDRNSVDRAANALIESIIHFYPRASAGRALTENLPEILKKMDETIERKARKSVSEALSNMPMN